MTSLLRRLPYLGLVGTLLAVAPARGQTAEEPVFDPIRTLYSPPGDAPTTGANHPRVIEVHHVPGMEGNLLATLSRREESYPVFRSTDGGDHWHLWSEIEETKHADPSWQLTYHPTLLELPQQVGEFPAGTILAAGLAFPADGTATELQLYASRDGGKSWEYLSTIVEGGPPQTRTSNPVWAPHLSLDLYGRLVAHYADERHKAEGFDQLLAQKVSPDGGRTWEAESYTVAVPGGELRPGMPVVTRLPDGRFLLAYEIVGMPNDPVHFKISDDGVSWGNPAETGAMIQDANGNFISGTPFVSWSPFGGPNGTLIASGLALQVGGERVGNGVMINRNLGQGPWQIVETPIHYDPMGQAGYGQSHLPLGDGSRVLQLVPVPNGFREHNDVRYSVFGLTGGE